jgi:hypothetical protein
MLEVEAVIVRRCLGRCPSRKEEENRCMVLVVEGSPFRSRLVLYLEEDSQHSRHMLEVVAVSADQAAFRLRHLPCLRADHTRSCHSFHSSPRVLEEYFAA